MSSGGKNKNLDELAKTVFRRWFINNSENENWEIGSFTDFIESKLNGDWGKQKPEKSNTERVYCVRGADIPVIKYGNKGKMPIRYILPKNFQAKKLKPGDIVVEISGGSPTQSTGRAALITSSLLHRYSSPMVCTNFCKAISPKPGYSFFLYFYWQYLYEKGKFFSYENGTTGIKNLDFNSFIDLEPIVIPPINLIRQFNGVCESIFSEIFQNGSQTEILCNIRDLILPKLLSGEIEIK